MLRTSLLPLAIALACVLPTSASAASAIEEGTTRWEDYSILGVDAMLAETAAGDLMCHSTDGVNCTPANKVDPKSPGQVRPVVCSALHRQTFGFEGYDRAGHWCQTPRIVQRAKNRWTAPGDLVNGFQTPTWVADDEPAVVVRANVPAGRALSIFTATLLGRPTLTGEGSMMVGGVVGNKVAMFAYPHYPNVTWQQPLFGTQTFGFKVTPNQHLCFFRQMSWQGGDFFGDRFLLWNSKDVAQANGERDLLISSSIPARTSNKQTTNQDFLDTPRVMWSTGSGESLRLDEVVTVVARRVPVEGSLTGETRKVSYAQGCDKSQRPTLSESLSLLRFFRVISLTF